MLCPLCAASVDGAFIHAHERWTLHHCVGCDVQFWYPMSGPGAEWYQNHWCYREEQVRDSLRLTGLRWEHRQFLTDAPAAGGRLLDVGCGSGAFLRVAEDMGYQAAGIDFSARMVDIALTRYKVSSVHVAELRDWAQRSAVRHRYDVVTAFQVLEHQDDVGGFIHSVGEVLKPGGCLVLSVPNRTRWAAHRLDAPHLTGDFPPHHFTRWSPQALMSLCGRCGFSVTALRQEPPSAGWVGVLLRELLGIHAFGRRLWRRPPQPSQVSPGQGDVPLILDPIALGAAKIAGLLFGPLALAVAAYLRVANVPGPTIYLLGHTSDRAGGRP